MQQHLIAGANSGKTGKLHYAAYYRQGYGYRSCALLLAKASRAAGVASGEHFLP
jgi:hypothetical protein